MRYKSVPKRLLEETIMKELMSEFTAFTTEVHKLEKKIADDWREIL